VRFLLAFAALLLTGCGPGLVFNNLPDMTYDQMSARATHVFIGVVEKQEFENWLFLGVPSAKRGEWALLKRYVQVETVIRGNESRRSVVVYEYFPTGAAIGNSNLTRIGERYLFLVRVENGRYHLVLDLWRNIFPIYSGKHDRLPLDDSHPFWERVGLLCWWLGEGHSSKGYTFNNSDPGRALGLWRVAKIARGLLRHPERETRILGCETLLMYSWQDECLNLLSPEDRAAGHLEPATSSAREDDAITQWKWAVQAGDIDMMRLLTAVNIPALRSQFCRLFTQRFRNDHDNGCPADQPPPATIVTQDGDVPLVGAWPQVQQWLYGPRHEGKSAGRRG
jgi:hypothetical protein